MKKRLRALLLAGLMILTAFPLASADNEDGDELPSWYDSSMDRDSAWDDSSTDDSAAWDDSSTDEIPTRDDSSTDELPSWYDSSMDSDTSRDDASTDDSAAWDDSSTDEIPTRDDASTDDSSSWDDTTGEEYPWLTRSPDDGVTDAGDISAVDGRDTGYTEEYPWLLIQDSGDSAVSPEPDTNRDGVSDATDNADTETERVVETTEAETEYLYDDGEEDTELQDLLQKERLEAVKDAESARQALLDLMESMDELLESRAAESNPDNGDTPDGSGGGGTSSPPDTTEPEPVDDTWEWESSEADDLLALYTEAVTAQAATEYVESADVVIDRQSVLKLATIAENVNTVSGEFRQSSSATNTANSKNITVKKPSATNNKAENADISVDPLVTDSHASGQSDTESMSLYGVITGATVLSKRVVNKTVTFSSDKTDITIRIEPDVKSVTTVDKIQVKTPSYSLIFTIADLKPDLDEALIIHCREAGSMDAESGGSKIVEVDLPNGKLTNPFTVSMPAIDGSVTYQTLASVQGASGYVGNARNHATDDYRLNYDVDLMAGSKTKAIPSKENPATKNMEGRTAESGLYTNINNPKDFTDIANKSKEMQNAIRYLASKGIINGTSDTTFSPDNPITRAHIVALIMRGLGKVDNSLQAHFSDVPSNVWYYHELASSEKLNIINGFSDGTFRGNNTINKAQITTVAGRILVSEMKYKAPEGTTKDKYLKKYKDEVPGYAKDMVALATREDLVVYRTDGKFSGDSLMTRGDAAILLYRLFKRIWY